MYMRFPGGKVRAVTLSYDDGVIFDKKLIEIMDKYGLKGTFNINSGLFRKDSDENSNRMTLDEAKKLYINSGHEVAVHSLNHLFMEKLTDSDILSETILDKQNIEKEFGIIARGMAYPFGTYNDRVIDVLKRCGICYSRTVNDTENFEIPENWLELNPTCRHTSPKLLELVRRFFESYSWGKPQLFYLWGHSYEFNNDNNWNVIEDFAKKIGGREDVWYATNIEIYDYVMAYRRLEMSFDKKVIYNPSAQSVWVYTDGETFEIKAGETLHR